MRPTIHLLIISQLLLNRSSIVGILTSPLKMLSKNMLWLNYWLHFKLGHHQLEFLGLIWLSLPAILYSQWKRVKVSITGRWKIGKNKRLWCNFKNYKFRYFCFTNLTFATTTSNQQILYSVQNWKNWCLSISVSVKFATNVSAICEFVRQKGHFTTAVMKWETYFWQRDKGSLTPTTMTTFV